MTDTQNEQDTDFLEVLQEENEVLDITFEKTMSTLNDIIRLYTVDLDSASAQDEYREIIEKLNVDPLKLLKDTSRLHGLEKKFQKLYRKEATILAEINVDSHTKISTNFDSIYEKNLKDSKMQNLEKNIGELKPIELDTEEEFSLDLSKEELLKILNLEKEKRASLTFVNQNIYEPELEKLESLYEKWGVRDVDLKRFFTHDVENINKKIEQVKKTENLDI